MHEEMLCSRALYVPRKGSFCILFHVARVAYTYYFVYAFGFSTSTIFILLKIIIIIIELLILDLSVFHQFWMSISLRNKKQIVFYSWKFAI